MPFRLNHYVTEWYQYRFIPDDAREKKFFYLDKTPAVVVRDGHRYKRNELLRWGPNSCFYQRDLYTTRFGEQESTKIEEEFFGPIDFAGKAAVEYIAGFQHPSVNHDAIPNLLKYMSVQKMRTPKGLAAFAEFVGAPNQNATLQRMMQLHQIHCATWTEAVWSILDASESPTKFIISDNPVTVYNSGCFPESKWCREFRDPDIRMIGSHTLFPLGLDKLLVLTNLNWARDPYSDPVKLRTNPALFHEAMFSFLAIQTQRVLTEREVRLVNHIIKSRALRYVAAAEKAWLYPEQEFAGVRWDKLADPYLLMPDPRSMTFSGGIAFGGGGVAGAFNEYGIQPGQPGYEDQKRFDREWAAFHAFQGEFARLHGPRRRGRAMEMADHFSPVEDTPEWHKTLLGYEARNKAQIRKRK